MEEICHDEIALKWTPGDIKCLIKLYGENISDFDCLPKKRVWAKIAAEMRQIRFKTFSAEQCDGKWKGLKAMFKKVKYHNNVSGNKRKSWEYFDELDKILFRRPEITPPATCSSDEGTVRLRPDFQPHDYSFDDIIEDTSSSSTSLAGARVSNIGRKRKAEDVEGAARAKRHDEKMEQIKRFLDLFEKLIDGIVTKGARVSNVGRKRKAEDVEAAARAKRHDEKMEQTKRFLDLFEKLIDGIVKKE